MLGKRPFSQPQSISRHLYCSICQEVFKTPMRTLCGHTFCYMCIQNWARYKVKCPICKANIKKRPLEKDLVASQIIDDLPIKCSFDKCQWKGQLSQYKKHARICQNKPKRKIQDISQGFFIEVDSTSNVSKSQSLHLLINIENSDQKKR